MSSSLLITLEMAGVLGVVLAFGFYELWSLRREKERDKAREMDKTGGTTVTSDTHSNQFDQKTK